MGIWKNRAACDLPYALHTLTYLNGQYMENSEEIGISRRTVEQLQLDTE